MTLQTLSAWCYNKEVLLYPCTRYASAIQYCPNCSAVCSDPSYKRNQTCVHLRVLATPLSGTNPHFCGVHVEGQFAILGSLRLWLLDLSSALLLLYFCILPPHFSLALQEVRVALPYFSNKYLFAAFTTGIARFQSPCLVLRSLVGIRLHVSFSAFIIAFLLCQSCGLTSSESSSEATALARSSFLNHSLSVTIPL